MPDIPNDFVQQHLHSTGESCLCGCHGDVWVPKHPWASGLPWGYGKKIAGILKQVHFKYFNVFQNFWRFLYLFCCPPFDLVFIIMYDGMMSMLSEVECASNWTFVRYVMCKSLSRLAKWFPNLHLSPACVNLRPWLEVKPDPPDLASNEANRAELVRPVKWTFRCLECSNKTSHNQN